MHTVLIVDDEPVVREGLMYIIDWEKEGFTIIDTASNGAEGLEKIRDLQPDLVLTDVRMPELDGIGMVKEAKKNGYHKEFLILSGYSDFTYAKEAIRLGVSSYLLKPIEEEELIEELRKIGKVIKEKEKHKQTLAFYESYSESAKIREYLLNGQLNDDLLAILSYDNYQLIGCDYSQSHIQRRQIQGSFKQLLTGEGFLFNHGTIYFALIVNQTDREIRKLAETLTTYLTDMDDQLYLLLSSCSDQQEQLPSLYREIKQLQKSRYLYQDVPLISKQTLAEKKEARANQANGFDKATWKANLLWAIKNDEKNKIYAYLQEIGHYYKQNDWSERDIKADLAALFNYYCDEMEDSVDLPLKEQEKRYIMSIILSEQSLEQTFVFLKEIFIDFSRFFDAAYDNRDIVTEMKDYTRKHYHENLTLQELGKELNYSHSYLGKKFRSQENMSYRTYLDVIRIDEAKRLLKENQFLVYEIAEKVGYTNSDYFYKKFKKIVGKSPRSFQKELKEGNDWKIKIF